MKREVKRFTEFFAHTKRISKKGVLFCLCAAAAAAVSVLCLVVIPGGEAVRLPAEYIPSEVSSDTAVNDKMNAMLSDTPKGYINENDIRYCVDVTDEGVVPNSPDYAEKNVKRLNKIIKSAGEYTKIVFPEGSYYLKASFRGIKINGKSNIIICGSGDVRLINTSYSPAAVKSSFRYGSSNIFNISGCKNIKIENIAIDYKSHTSADGIITKVADGKTYFSVSGEFANGDKTPLEGGEFVASVLIADENGFSDEVWAEDTILLEKGYEKGEFCVPVSVGKAGNRICCRFTLGTYASPAVCIQNTSGFEAKDVSCFSCPSAVFYAPCGNSDFTFSGVTVMTEDGRGEMLASNEDCIHIEGLSGRLYVTDSVFRGIGDDALNVHGSLAVVLGTAGGKVTLAGGRTGKAPGRLWAVTGDTVEFFDEQYNSLGTAQIKSFNGRRAVFDKLPEGVTVRSFAQNVSFNPDTVVKNCRVELGRARALLLQTKNAAVSECFFKDIRLSAILIAPDFDYWYESGFADNAVIMNNTFENCTASDAFTDFGVITVGSCHDRIDPEQGGIKMHKNISVFENSFIGCGNDELRAASVRNLKSDIAAEMNVK